MALRPTADNLQKLMGVISACQRPEKNVREPAENQVLKLRQMPGYTTCMMTIATNGDVKIEARQFASIELKNTFRKYWQRRGNYFIPEEEKNTMKKAMLSERVFSINNTLVFRQLSFGLAQLARFDWPRKWGSLFPTLLKIITKGDELQINNGLHVLLEVLKILTQRRWMMQRQEFQKQSQPLLAVILPAWINTTKQLFDALKGGKEKVAVAVRIGHRSLAYLRCLKELAIYGIPNLDRSEHAQSLFQAFKEVLTVLMPLSRSIPRGHPLRDTLRSMVTCVMGTVIGAQKQHPLDFSRYLGPFVKFFTQTLREPFDKDRELIFEKQTVMTVNLLSNVLSCPQYTSLSGSGLVFSATSGIQTDPQAENRIRATLKQIFNNGFVSTLLNVAIYRLLLLKPSDIQEWEADSEDYAMELHNDKEMNIRSATHTLIEHLARVFPQVTCPVLMSAVNKLVKNNDIGKSLNERVVIKNALYRSLGCAAFHVSKAFEANKLPFAAWFKMAILRDLEQKEAGANGRFASARAVWCLGEWVESVDDQLRPECYRAISMSLSNPDVVVRMMAAKSLKSLVDSFKFKETSHIYVNQYLQAHVQGLLKLINDLRGLDGRRVIADVLKVVVQTLQDRITPIIPMLMQHIPTLWEMSEEQDMLRTTLILILKDTVKALGPGSTSVHRFALPVLGYCLKPNSTARAHLLEYAFELWHCVVSQSPVLSKPILDLFPAWAHHVTTSTEHLQVALQVLESYIYLGGVPLLKVHGKLMQQGVCKLFDDVKEEGRELICRHIEPLAMALPKQFTVMMQPLVVKVSKEMVDAAQALDQKRRPQVSDKTLKAYSRIITRLLYHDPQGYAGLLQRVSGGKGPKLLGAMIGLWVDRLGDSWELFRKKVAAFAMLNCLAMGNRELVGHHLQGVLAYASSVMAEEGNRTAPPDYSAVRQVPEAKRTERHRQLILYSQDTSTQKNVRRYAQDVLKKIAQQVGDQQLRALLQRMDPLIVNVFK